MWCVQEPGCPCDDWAFVLNASSLEPLHHCIAKMATVHTGSLYLTNNLRTILNLNSVEPAHRVQEKAEEWAARTGKMVYIQGLGEIGGTPPTTIGTISISGNRDIETGSASEFSCVFTGDCIDPVYRWSTNSSNIAIVGTKTSKTVQISGVSATSGNCWLLCTVSSATATDGSGDAQTKITVTDPPAPAKVTTRAATK